jgi:hypothetical protein
MGYYVTLTDTNAVLPKDNLLNAYRRLCALNERNDLKRGGRLGSPDVPLHGAHPDTWFSWMDWNYPDVHPDAEAILRAVGFNFYTDYNGNLVFTGYHNKTGCEQVFVDAISQYLASSDDRPVQFVWTGEDNAVWRQVRYDDTFVVEAGRLVFEQETISV